MPTALLVLLALTVLLVDLARAVYAHTLSLPLALALGSAYLTIAIRLITLTRYW